ncbi:MAG TPA: hypothetical protein VGR30_20465 [Candidatus Binatia bacterium]|jgi:hypothetical protein|nr:hypothetical protein [Candidatus Binatia bacterium]
MAFPKHNGAGENICSYCLYFQPVPTIRRRRGGNCSYHKQWIDNGSRTTCSDMSQRRLEKGIYQLVEESRGKWLYVRRKEKVRTRLFLVPK